MNLVKCAFGVSTKKFLGFIFHQHGSVDTFMCATYNFLPSPIILYTCLSPTFKYKTYSIVEIIVQEQSYHDINHSKTSIRKV